MSGKLPLISGATIALTLAVILITETQANLLTVSDRSSTLPDREVVEKIEDELLTFVEKYDTPGVTAAFVVPNEIFCRFAAGWADTEYAFRMRVDHRMHAGSHPKSFAAALALALEQEKKLSLDDSIRDYLQTFPWYRAIPDGDKITIRMLMGMGTGLRAHFSGSDDHVPAEDSVYSPRNLQEHWSSYKSSANYAELLNDVKYWSVPFSPGTDAEYTDEQYILLGIVLETASGEKFEEAVQRRFLYPLQMSLTSPADSRVVSGAAKGYTDPNTRARGVEPWTDRSVVSDGVFDIDMGYPFTSGSYFSNSGDLARWAATFYGGRLFESGYLAELEQSYSKSRYSQEGKQPLYGLGVIRSVHSELGAIRGHSGGMPGYATIVNYYVEPDIAVAAQFNMRYHEREIGELVHRIASLVAKGDWSREHDQRATISKDETISCKRITEEPATAEVD